MKQQHRETSLIFGATCVVVVCALFAEISLRFFPEAIPDRNKNEPAVVSVVSKEDEKQTTAGENK